MKSYFLKRGHAEQFSDTEIKKVRFTLRERKDVNPTGCHL